MSVNQLFQYIPAHRALCLPIAVLVTIELHIKSICEHFDARTGIFKTLWLVLQRNYGAATILPFHYQ